MKFIKKAAAAIVAASLAVSLCSCGSNLSWSAKVGDDLTVPSGLYIYAMSQAYTSAVSNSLLNKYTELSKQTVEVSGSDMSAFDYLDKEGKDKVKSYVGAYQMAKELDVALDDKDIEGAESSAKSAYDADKTAFEKLGVAESSIVEYYKDVALKTKVFEAVYGKDGTKAISDNELKTFFKENYANISFIQQYFYTEDGNVMSKEQKDALKKEYEKIKSNAEKGKTDFNKLCKEYQTKATNYKGGYVNSLSRFDTEDEQGKKILDLKEGKFTMLVTDQAIALIQKQPLDKDGKSFTSQRDTLLMGYKYDAFIKELIKYAEGIDGVKFNDKAFEKFSSSTRDFSDLNTNSSYGY